MLNEVKMDFKGEATYPELWEKVNVDLMWGRQ